MRREADRAPMWITGRVAAGGRVALSGAIIPAATSTSRSDLPANQPPKGPAPHYLFFAIRLLDCPCAIVLRQNRSYIHINTEPFGQGFRSSLGAFTRTFVLQKQGPVAGEYVTSVPIVLPKYLEPN